LEREGRLSPPSADLADPECGEHAVVSWVIGGFEEFTQDFRRNFTQRMDVVLRVVTHERIFGKADVVRVCHGEREKRRLGVGRAKSVVTLSSA